MYERTYSVLTTSQQSLLDELPRDIRTALKRFDIEPDVTYYACCPKCFATYAPIGDNKDDPEYPSICSHRDTPDQDECGHWLFVPGTGDGGGGRKIHKMRKKLVRRFGYQPPFAWLARLLSRPGLEKHMEDAWKVPSVLNDEQNIKDVFLTDVLRTFPTAHPPDGRLFSECPNDELHLVFSLFVDWFNPYGNKKGGKSNSVGAIYMICLNLPPSIRYNLANVYLVGIIPGPRNHLFIN